MVNLRDVAELASVAPSTVSRVVNNAPNIAPETRKVVEEAIERLGYRPNRRGRPIRSTQSYPTPRKTNRITLLTTGMRRAVMNSPVYMSVIHGVEAALAEKEKVMVLRHLPNDETTSTTLFSQKTDGVLHFGGTTLNDDLRKHLREIPCVGIMGGIDSEEEWDHVSYANHRIGRLAADYLLQRGHQHMAIVLQTDTSSKKPKYSTFRERLDVFSSTVRKKGGDCLELADEHILTYGDYTQKGSPEAIQKLFDTLLAVPSASRPTGVFLTADILVPPFYQEMQRRGMTPGKELELISCNNEHLLLAHLHPRPATIDIHAEQVGRRAVEQLLWRIENPDSPQMTLLLNPTLVETDERVGTDVSEPSGNEKELNQELVS